MDENNNKPKNPVLHHSDGVSIRDYVDRLFGEHQRAIDKAEEMMNKRLEGMNEFRSQLKDQAARFITREELNIICSGLQVEIKALRKLADIAEGKASQNSVILATAGSLIGIVIGLIAVFGK